MRRHLIGPAGCCLTLLISVAATGADKPGFLASYKGVPFADSRYHDGAQKIPGKVLCAFLRPRR